MFTDNETKRIKSFLKEYRSLDRVGQNLRNRLWYGTHGTGSPTKEAQIANRYRKLLLSQKKVYNKSVEYANALKRKYGMRIYTMTRPNLHNVGWARRRNVARRTAERALRPSSLAPNTVRHIARMAYPSPPRARTAVWSTNGFMSGRRPQFIYHEPW